MNAQLLQDAIGEVRDDYILDAHAQRKKRGKPFWKAVAAAACLCLIVCTALPALAAAGNDFAYEALYMALPGLAQQLKPVHRSCVDNGIKMEVISAKIEDNRADILLSMQDVTAHRLDETTDLFDSYSIYTPFDSTGTCRLVDYDEKNDTAFFLVTLTQWDDVPIPGDKITFCVSRLLTGKRHIDTLLPEIDLASAPVNPEAQTSPSITGGGSREPMDEDHLHLLIPQKEDTSFVPDGVAFTGYGIVDGKLHVQFRYEDIRNTDNHGDISLKGPDGERIDCTQNVYFKVDSRDAFVEYIFDTPLELLSQCRVNGEFWTCPGTIDGNWQITFPLTEE